MSVLAANGSVPVENRGATGFICKHSNSGPHASRTFQKVAAQDILVSMSNVRAQASAIINTCKAVMAGKGGGSSWGIDQTTYGIAQAIIEAAKAEVPGDKILQAVKMEGVMSWTGLLSLMETVVASLPQQPPSVG